MKKLILNKINFEGAIELTREQLKRVMGGDSGETTVPEDITTQGGALCRFKYKYTDNPTKAADNN